MAVHSKIIPLVLLIFYSSCVQAQESTRVFNMQDFQAALAGNPEFEAHASIQNAYNGSDPGGCYLSWTSYSGNFRLLNFESKSTGLQPQSLRGWVNDGAVVLHPTPVHLVLVYSDDLVHPLQEQAISSVGQFAEFSLNLPTQPRSKRFTLLVHNADDAKEGTVTFADVRLVDGANPSPPSWPLEPVQRPKAPPATNPSWQTIHQFEGNDFDPHADHNLDMLSMNPVTVLTGNQTREINLMVPSRLPHRMIPVMSMDDPGITSGEYAIAGEMSYGNSHGGFTFFSPVSIATSLSDGEVEGVGYLEMISDFADGTTTCTRTQDSSGPMREIRGRSGARSFSITAASTKHPTRLRLNLVMPGRGTVALANLRLMQSAPMVSAIAQQSNDSRWFNPRLLFIPVMILPMFSFIALLQPMVRRGKARLLVQCWIWCFFALAQLSFAWAMAGLGYGLRVRDIGPSLLASALVLGCTLFAGPRMARRYRDVELKRMQLMDIV